MRMHPKIGTLAFVAIIAGCQSPEPPRIGIVLSSDGEHGARLAADEITARSGFPNHPFMLRILKGGSTEAASAIRAAEILAADRNVLGVVGHSNSAATLSASKIYNERHLSHIAPTSTAALLDEAGPYSFRMVGSDVHQARFIAQHIRVLGKERRIAILFVNDDYGRGLAEQLRNALKDVGASIAYDAPFGEGPRFGDASENARGVAQTRPDVVVWLGRGEELARLLPQLRSIVPHPVIIASDGVQDQADSRMKGAFGGIRYVRIAVPREDAGQMDALRRRFQSRFGYALTNQALLSYEAVKLYADAIGAVGADRDRIRDYITSLGHARKPFQGASGPIEFDEKGSGPASYELVEISAAGEQRTLSRTAK